MADPSHLSYYLDPSLPGSSIESTNSRKDAFQGAGVFFFDPEEAAFFLLRRGEPPTSILFFRRLGIFLLSDSLMLCHGCAAPCGASDAPILPVFAPSTDSGGKTSAESSWAAVAVDCGVVVSIRGRLRSARHACCF